MSPCKIHVRNTSLPHSASKLSETPCAHGSVKFAFQEPAIMLNLQITRTRPAKHTMPHVRMMAKSAWKEIVTFILLLRLALPTMRTSSARGAVSAKLEPAKMLKWS